MTVSPFGERHSAWHWYAGFNEMYDPGQSGRESAEELSPVALDGISRHGKTATDRALWVGQPAAKHRV